MRGQLSPHSDCPLIRSDEALWRNVIFSIKNFEKSKPSLFACASSGQSYNIDYPVVPNCCDVIDTAMTGDPIAFAIDCLSSTLGVATNDMTTTGYARPDAMVRFHGPA